MKRGRALAVVDLGLFPGQKLQPVELLRCLATQRPAEALDAVVAALEAKAIHQILVDRHGVATQTHLRLDPCPVRLAG